MIDNSTKQHEAYPYEGEALFTTKRLLIEYLPRRLIFFVIPISILLVVFVGNDSRITYLVISLAMFSMVSISNYFYCREKHLDLEAEYGEQYKEKLNSELARVGFNRLIDRFWLGVEPES